MPISNTNQIASKPASQLTKEEYATRAGVDAARIQGSPGSFTVGNTPMDPGFAIKDTSPNTDPGFTNAPNPAPTMDPGFSKVATSAVGPDGQPIYDVFSGTEHIQDPNDPRLKGVNIAQLPTGQAPADFKSKFEQGFNTTKNSGTPSPTSSSDAQSLIDKSVPNNYNGGQTDLALSANQAHQQYLNDFAAYQSSLKQNETLTQEYTRLTTEAGIPALNTQLINMKAVMDGSEQDIQNEITKAGGFASNSQVLALTNARNKSMIQNYNNLLQTRDDMQKNITTMMGLSEQDRTYASQQIDKQLNFDQQQVQYADKMLTNAQDSLNNSAKAMGWQGILDAALATGDSQAINRINSTMGSGFDLRQAAQKEKDAKAVSDLKTSLENQQLQANLAKTNADVANAPLQTQKLQAEIAKTKAETRQLGLQNSGTQASGGLPQVAMTGDNIPSKVGQVGFLNALPGGATGELATLVKGIANYNINPSSVPTRNYKGVGGLTQSQVLTLVSQYDPSFSQANYASRQALMTNFASGKYSQNINALNTAVGHITDILSNTQGLNNTGFTPYNTAKNALAKLFGSGAIGQATMNIAAATSELATVFKGTGATDDEIKFLKTIDANSSPAQVKATIETATQLLASRLQALDDTYTSGMGKAPANSFLSPTSQKGLLDLQKKGLNIQVPDLMKSPLVKLQTFHDVDQQHAQLLQQLGQSMPALAKDPQAMIDYLAQQGIEL